MTLTKTLKRTGLIVLAALSVFIIHYCWISFPVITGFASKNAASSIFVAGRTIESVKSQELAFSPISLAKITVNFKDSSVTASLFGLAKRKCIYRKGLGCTTINDLSEKEIRAQHFNLALPPNINTDTIPWPQGDLISDQISSAINKEKLYQAIQNVFKEPDTLHKVYTRAVVVVYDGKLIAEQYAPGFNKNSKMLGWSMTKSVISALTGILIQQGKLNLMAPAPVPEWEKINDPRHIITIKNILQQSTGLDFEEDYQKSSDATKMLFESGNMSGYAASRPIKDTPGTVFYYSSGNTNILSKIIRQTLGDSMYYRFPYDSLFYKIGMYSAVIEPDASGTFVGSSYMYATPRDWARFGLLYLNNGTWNNQQILPKEWVTQTYTPTPSSPLKDYGYMFWLNGFDADKNAMRHFPDVPADMYCASGYGGQKVVIIPSKKLVVVRLGLNPVNDNDLLKNIIAALPL